MSAEAFVDSRFAALPKLLRDATNPEMEPADIRRFMDRLLEADRSLFEGVLQCLSREGQTFVLVRENPPNTDAPRSWLRWPLKRLFAARRASLITNPATKHVALAIPFELPGERHVVIAPLAVQTPDATQDAFLHVLQSVPTASPAERSGPQRATRFIWYGTHRDLAKRVGRMLSARGWPMSAAPTFGHVLTTLDNDAADIVLLEGTASAGPGILESLRAMRHAATIGDAPIVYFGDSDPPPEIRTLVDFSVHPTASDSEILRVLKSSTRILTRTRMQGLRSAVHRIVPQLLRCTALDELARVGTQAATALGWDVVSLLLVDDSDRVHAFHAGDGGLFTADLPAPFITGEPVTSASADERFFSQAFYDPHIAARLRVLKPTSAAALPVRNGAQIAGTIIALSTSMPMIDADFAALEELCEGIGNAASRIARQMLKKPWHEVVLDDCIVECYAGAAASPFAVASKEDVAVIVAMTESTPERAAELAKRLLDERIDPPVAAGHAGNRERGIFVARLEHLRLRYACRDFPLPLRVPASGPTSAIRIAQGLEHGTLALDDDSTAVLLSEEFAQQSDTAQIVGALQRELRRGSLRVGGTLFEIPRKRKKIAFAAITTRSTGARTPHQPAFV